MKHGRVEAGIAGELPVGINLPILQQLGEALRVISTNCLCNLVEARVLTLRQSGQTKGSHVTGGVGCDGAWGGYSGIDEKTQMLEWFAGEELAAWCGGGGGEGWSVVCLPQVFFSVQIGLWFQSCVFVGGTICCLLC